MNFSEAPEFQKDIKRLAKKWRSIPQDIEATKQYILPLYVEMSPDVMVEVYRHEFFANKRATILHSGDDVEMVKMRLDVESTGRSDKARIIFITAKTESAIMFIELYAKNEKSREDRRRLKKYLS